MENEDFHDMLCELKNAGVEFLVIGAHALGAHGIIRGTLDFDIWVRPTEENARRIWSALISFGAPMGRIEEKDFVTPGLIYQIGVAPNRIDILNTISGVDFEEAWNNRIEAEVFGVAAHVIGRDELLKNKRATDRPKDRNDADDLENNQTR